MCGALRLAVVGRGGPGAQEGGAGDWPQPVAEARVAEVPPGRGQSWARPELWPLTQEGCPVKPREEELGRRKAQGVGGYPRGQAKPVF